MKVKIMVLLAFAGLCIQTVEAQSLPLKDALKQGLIRINAYGLGGFSGEKLEIYIKNVSKKKVEISISSGDFMQPQSTDYQRLIVSETLALSLKPGQEKTERLYTFCSEQHKGSPPEKMKFTPTGRADKDLADLAKLIEDSQWQGDGAAQQAIWCLTDNADIQWLMSENQDKERKLREFVAAVKKIDLSKLPRIKRTTVVYSEVGQLHKTAKLDIDTIDYRGGERGREIRNTLKNREVGDEKDKIASDGGAVGKQIDAAIQKKKAQDEKEYQAQKAMESWSLNEIKGSIEVVIKEPARIKIQLIRPDGTLLKEVYDSKDVVAGKAKFPYKHKDYNLPIGKYLIRVLGNNKIVKEEEYILK